jgi:HlyD family secretion protein
VIGIVLGGAGVHFGGNFLRDRHSPVPADATVTKTKVSALGRLQPKGGVISVFGLPGDRIEKLSVKLGDPVAKDAVLAELASRTDRELERDLVAVQLREARAQRAAIGDTGKAKIAAIDAEIAQLQSGRDGDLKAQDAKLASLMLQCRVANDSWNRLKSLERSPVSAQDLEKCELLFHQSDSELTAARAIRDKTEKGYGHNDAALKAKWSAAVAELDEAVKRVPVDSLTENLKIAERRLEASQVKAPVAGRVLKVIGHEGDVTGNQPIFQVADINEMVVIAEVYETDVQAIEAWFSNSRVRTTITSRALGKHLAGEAQVNQITHLISRNQLFSLNPREDIDRRVVEVCVDVLPESVELASSYVGLEVQVEFQPAPKP